MRNRSITKWRARAGRATRLAVGRWAIPLSLFLGACAGDSGPVAPTDVNARLDRGAGRIVVNVDGLRPSERVDRVRLVGPDGQVFAPETRRRARSVEATTRRPTVGVQARGGSASGIEPGLTLSLDLFDWSWGGSETVDRRRVTAVFAVPRGCCGEANGWRVEAIVIDAAGQPRTYRRPVAGR